MRVALPTLLLMLAPALAASGVVTLQTSSGTLYGTLELPETSGPYPAALILPGSGPTDRDGNSAALPGKNDSLKLLAEGLAERGMASLRIDKRGIGASAAAGASEAELRFDSYVTDAVAWLERLQSDDRFSKVAVIGHSEGSLIGMLAAERAGASAFVSIAGVGEPATDTLRRQLGAQLPANLMQGVEQVLKSLEAGQTMNPLPENVAAIPGSQALFRPSVQPYLISWFRYDPGEIIARLKMPVLIVQGSQDLQVQVADAQRLVQADPQARLELIDGMNHILKDAPSDPQGNLATYSDPGLPLADGLVDAVASFLKAP